MVFDCEGFFSITLNVITNIYTYDLKNIKVLCKIEMQNILPAHRKQICSNTAQ